MKTINLTQITNDTQYREAMKRIDTLFFGTDENTPADDPRLQELDELSKLIEEYERSIFR